MVDVSPNCDCHGENDVPILPDLGMFASFDPLALDQACVDACLQALPLPGSQLAANLAKRGFVDHHDHFTNSDFKYLSGAPAWSMPRRSAQVRAPMNFVRMK